MKKYVKLCAAALCAAAVVVIVIWTGVRDRDSGEYTENTILMGTSASFTVYGANGDDMIDEMSDRLSALETDVISWREENSELHELNATYQAGQNYEVSAELAHIIESTIDISERSGKLLDITIRPLAELWGIEDGSTEVPDAERIKEALAHVDGSKVSAEESDGKYYVNISEEGMSLDLGAVGKGYGCDAALKYLTDTDVTGACVSLGGSILVYGEKPDASTWKVAVRDPRSGAYANSANADSEGTSTPGSSSDDILGVIDMPAGATAFVSTSGDYEKYFIKDSVRYHHILDPTTGYPAAKGTISATVVCDNGLLSDALSTLGILMDREAALDLIEQYGAEAVLVDEDRNVYVTSGLEGRFTLTATGYTVETVQ